ncbi:hypothetical protein ADU59_12995 [Pararhizobium polonicum]|uniref:Pentapeptide repeat protein n=2 Tax=Pararhizobium polonicum TaxID=1612624 RepID=A0A1C7P1H2_9HYPH|nr:hypothetical protein ADU59_12995 [Pararhizobium polonicum]
MQKISQGDLEANLAAQAQGEACDLSNADLSAILWNGLDLSGTTIALSLIRDAHFSAGQVLHGCCWIGNRIENCVFASISISKSEMLDCEFNGCAMEAMQLFRADLSGTLFSSCRFVDVDFSQATMIRVGFENCIFVQTRLTKDLLFTGTGDFVFSAGELVSPDR